jgi:hypothetical protein
LGEGEVEGDGAEADAGEGVCTRRVSSTTRVLVAVTSSLQTSVKVVVGAFVSLSTSFLFFA